MSDLLASGVVLGTSLLAALVLTGGVRTLALRLGVVARPSSDRWHRQPTALLGGVAIALATGLGLVVATMVIGDEWAVRPAAVRPALGLAASSLFMVIVGLIDDLVQLRPQSKVLLQLLAGAALLSVGAVLPVTPWYVANVVATLFWFVAVTNAFNLLDGLDGVAAGVGAIASFFLGLTFAHRGAWTHAAVAWSLTGATIGFLRFNFHPASIFMGDAGSLFLGSVLAGLVVTSPATASGSLVSVLFVPLAIVAVPLLDTSLVTVTRLLAGRPISQGGLDHSHYRLIALGLNQRQVAVLLYGFAAGGGLVSIVLTRVDGGFALVVGATFLVALSLFAAYLGRLQIGSSQEPRNPKGMTVLVRNLFYKRRLAEILLDVVLVTLANYVAYRFRFDGALPPEYAASFQMTIGLLIALKVVTFELFGVYRGAWDYVGMVDVYRVVCGAVVSAVALFYYAEWRVPALAASHSIIYVDALLTIALVLASRLSFRSLEMVRTSVQRGAERVLIYGAGHRGELALRELVSDRHVKLRPACFLDDDVRKQGAEIHGVPIIGGFETLPLAVDRYKIKRIVIATHGLSTDATNAIRAFAGGLGLKVGDDAFGVKWPAATSQTAPQEVGRRSRAENAQPSLGPSAA